MSRYKSSIFLSLIFSLQTVPFLVPLLVPFIISQAKAAEEEGPSAAEVKAWTETRNTSALTYHWTEFNPKEKKQVITWISSSKFARAPEWKPFYQKELERLIQIKNPQAGTCDYALKILRSLDHASENLNQISKLYLNWFASHELPALRMEAIESGVGSFLSEEKNPELVALRTADRRLNHELDVNLISAFQSLKLNPARPSIEAVSTLMRYGYDPLQMHLLSSPVHAEMLNYASEIQNLASLNKIRYLTRFSVNSSLKVEKQNFRPLALERYAFTATQAKPVYESAQKELLKLKDTYALLRNQIYFSGKGGSLETSPLGLITQDEIHEWVKYNPSEVKAILSDLSVAQIKNPTASARLLDPLIFEMRTEYPEELSKLTKQLIFDQKLRLSEVSERLWFSEATLSPYLRESFNAVKRASEIEPLIRKYEAVLGKDAVSIQLTRLLSESSLSDSEKQSFTRLISQNAAKSGNDASICSRLSLIRKFFK